MAGLSPALRLNLSLIRSGLSNKEIAAKRGVSLFTVKTQNIALYRALGVRNRTQAAMTGAT